LVKDFYSKRSKFYLCRS